MSQQFKNMNELVEYLGGLEARVKMLEEENSRLRALQPLQPVLPKIASVDGNMISQYVARYIPQTNLLSPSFFTRAFAVWGHFFVANFVISIFFGILYFCLGMVGLASTLSQLSQ